MNGTEQVGDHDWARDSDPVFTFLGLYLTLFQTIEGKVDQVVLLGAGVENWDATQTRLAKMQNHKKVEAMAEAVTDVAVFPLLARIPDWSSRIGKLVDLLHAERRRRNLVMHSQYLMEGLEHGLPAIRSARTRQANPGFDQEDLTRARMDEILREAAQLAFDVGIVNAQIIQAMPRPGRDSVDAT
jgi:transcriptional regulator of met regulon